MPWEHRVMNHLDARFGDYLMIHEVYDEGRSWSTSTHPGGRDLDELRAELELMLLALDKPILEYRP